MLRFQQREGRKNKLKCNSEWKMKLLPVLGALQLQKHSTLMCHEQDLVFLSVLQQTYNISRQKMWSESDYYI